MNTKTITLFCLLVQFAVLCCYAEQSVPIAMTYDQFTSLSQDEQVNVIAKSFKRRVDFSNNISMEVEITGDAHTDGGIRGQVCELKMHYSKVERSLWILDNKYRQNAVRTNMPEQTLVGRSSLAFDLNEGIRKGISILSSNESRIFGRTDTVQTEAVFDNRYWRWLNDRFCDDITSHYLPQREYIFPSLLRNVSNWKIKLLPDEKMIQLSYPFGSNYMAKDVKNECTYILAPMKGFMPLSGKLKVDEVLIFTDENGKPIKYKPSGYEELFEVKDSVLVDDVWMPTLIEERAWASWVDNNTNLYHTKVSNISHGNVSLEDVSLKYPKGTEVVDVIEGHFYIADAEGNPVASTIKPLYDLDPTSKLPELPELPKKKYNVIFIVIGIFLIIVTIYMLLVKRKTKK